MLMLVHLHTYGLLWLVHGSKPLQTALPGKAAPPLQPGELPTDTEAGAAGLEVPAVMGAPLLAASWSLWRQRPCLERGGRQV